jgi:hypothetical protein
VSASTSKALWQSRTIVGLVIAALAMVLDRWGYRIDPALQGDLVNLIAMIGEVGGLAVAAWGRVVASKSIRVTGAGPAALAVLLVLGLATAGPIACASLAGETPAQKVYGIQADYMAAQEVAAAYLDSGRADAEAVLRIKQLDAAAWSAVGEARRAVRAGDSPALPAAMAAARHAVAALAAYLSDRGVR